MITLTVIRERLNDLGLNDPKYRFVPGPYGLPITPAEKNELEAIGHAAHEYIQAVDEWYRRAADNTAGSWLASVLTQAIPRGNYRKLTLEAAIPVTFMVDTVWTREGWRVVEIDVTNRNAYGYPPLLRSVHNLPALWPGIDEEWRASGWRGATQIMADHHRFYEPYFRFFLARIGGILIKEANLPAWLDTLGHYGTALLDLPILHRSKDILPRLFQLVEQVPIAITPKHHLSSKAILTLPWEMRRFASAPIRRFLPEGRLLAANRPRPTTDFFVKLLQSGGAHGTFHNDRTKLEELGLKRKPRAIWQQALPLATRQVAYLNEVGGVEYGKFYVRVSIFVNRNGQVVDADATCSPHMIVHGSKQSIMTVPMLA